jgi:carboxypeptidase T
MLQTVHDSIAYTIVPSTPNGQLIRYALKLNNGYYDVYDTVQFYYGKKYSITTPSTSSLTDWINNGWGISSDYHTAPSSIQSSISGSDPYTDNEDITISTATPVDLTYSTQAYLQFYAKWSIEADYDSVIISASVHGSGVWNPLCGLYTKVRHVGSIPVYDAQQPNWVREEMDLHDYIGQKVDIQFELASDAATDYQGFYFDDVNVTTVQDTPLIVQNVNPGRTSMQVYPNPAHDQLNIAISGSTFGTPLHAVMFDGLGRAVMNFTIDRPNMTINLQQLPVNVYYLRVSGSGLTLPVQKVTVIK